MAAPYAAGQKFVIVIVAVLSTGATILFLISILIMGLLTFGVRHKLLTPRKGSLLDRFLTFWCRLIPSCDVLPAVDKQPDMTTEEEMMGTWLKDYTETDIDEIMQFLITKKGRGRKSNYSAETRYRAVRDWILMQMRGTSTTCPAYLLERFGPQSNGDSHVPRDTFYGWYRVFKKEVIENRPPKKQ